MNRKFQVFGFYTAVVMLFLLSASLPVFGAGFALIEQNVSGLGNAYSGGAAVAEDASTIFYNPAGMTRLKKTEGLASIHMIIPSAKFSDSGSYTVVGTRLTGAQSGNAGVTAFVPNIYLSVAPSEKLRFGLGINSPFGLATEYDPSWVGRYHAIKSDMKTMNFNPSIAYKVSDNFSIGAGVDIQRIEAELSNAVDFGLIGAMLKVRGYAPQSADGLADLKGDSWSWGYNLGALYEFNQNTRAGVAYRSRIKQKLDGDVSFTGVPVFLAPTYKSGPVKADLTLPDTLSASVYHKITENVAATGDVTWTNWKTFDELRIRFDSGLADSVVTTQWKSVMRYSAGLSYTAGASTFKVGTALDKSPVPDTAHRTPRIPDGDRTWISGGYGYKFSDKLSVDLGLAHLFVKNESIIKTATTTNEDAGRGSLQADYKCDVDILSAQLVWKF